jgi:restriction system protein
VLTRGGERTVVQAKQWRAHRLGVQTVYELYGVQGAMQAEHSMIVALRYTAEAQQFGAHVGLTLVDGEEFVRIIGVGSPVRR